VAAITGAGVTGAEQIFGGDINLAWRVALDDGRTVFAKTNATPPPGMFAAERHGLGWLAAAGAIRVPQVIGHREHALVLEWMEPSGGRAAGALGRDLAALHASGAPCFGLAAPSFVATLPQDNTPCATWQELWFERRLRPLIERAIAAGRGPARWRHALDELAAATASIVPDEPPARLHGDLWSGNVLVSGGVPVLVDPAVYGGPREIDLAMLALFGGLDDHTASAYDEAFPLAPGWEERRGFWQLYPLLVHVVLFGGSYAASVERVFVTYRS
jgi:fructosamine-3-kinase